MSVTAELPSAITSISLVAIDIVRSIVEHPHQVSIEVLATDRSQVILLLTTHPDDLKELAGQDGRVLRALHTVIHAVAARNNLNIHLQVESQMP